MACVTETKTATCRCGLVDQKRFRGSLHVKCCNEEHLKNALENPCVLTMNFNDELNEKNLATTNEWCEFCVSWQPTMVSGFFSVAAWKKSFTVREREHRNESVPLSCCPIISDFTIAIGVGAYTIYSALKREKTVIIIIMMIMLHLNFFHAHLKNRHSFLLIALQRVTILKINIISSCNTIAKKQFPSFISVCLSAWWLLLRIQCTLHAARIIFHLLCSHWFAW